MQRSRVWVEAGLTPTDTKTTAHNMHVTTTTVAAQEAMEVWVPTQSVWECSSVWLRSNSTERSSLTILAKLGKVELEVVLTSPMEAMVAMEDRLLALGSMLTGKALGKRTQP